MNNFKYGHKYVPINSRCFNNDHLRMTLEEIREHTNRVLSERRAIVERWSNIGHSNQELTIVDYQDVLNPENISLGRESTETYIRLLNNHIYPQLRQKESKFNLVIKKIIRIFVSTFKKKTI